MKIVESVFKRITIDFADVDIAKNYCVVTVNQGVDFGLDQLQQLKEIANEHYSEPFCYIANHVHDYSMSPIQVIQFIIKTQHLKSVAFVSEQGEQEFEITPLIKVILERLEVKFFTTIVQAIEWINSEL